MTWTREGEVWPPPGRWVGGLSGLGPGQHAFFTARLDPGEYVLICYVNDPVDGKPHHDHGMVKQFTVH